MAIESSFKVVVLTHGNCLEFLKLASQSNDYSISEVFVETDQIKQRGIVEKLQRSIKYDGLAATVRKVVKRDEHPIGLDKSDELETLCKRFGIRLTFVKKFNSKLFREKLANASADLGVLYGTNIIRKSVYSIPRLGSVNIHTGKIPYYRGGPPIFWELFNDEKEIGITAHFVAPAVDTGEVIVQETTGLDYDFDKYGTDVDQFLVDFGRKLVPIAARVVEKAVSIVAKGEADPWTPDLTIGKRYRIPTYKEKKELIKRIIKRVS